MSEDILLCPVCDTENDALSRTCVNCGESLIVVCPRCNTVNAITAEQCFACGQQFDTLGQIIARHEVRSEDRFTRQAGERDRNQVRAKSERSGAQPSRCGTERQRQSRLSRSAQRRKAAGTTTHFVGAVIVVVVVVAIMLIMRPGAVTQTSEHQT